MSRNVSDNVRRFDSTGRLDVKLSRKRVREKKRRKEKDRYTLKFFSPSVYFQKILSEEYNQQTGNKKAIGRFRGSQTLLHILDHDRAGSHSDNIISVLWLWTCWDGTQSQISESKS